MGISREVCVVFTLPVHTLSVLVPRIVIAFIIISPHSAAAYEPNTAMLQGSPASLTTRGTSIGVVFDYSGRCHQLSATNAIGNRLLSIIRHRGSGVPQRPHLLRRSRQLSSMVV